MTHTLNKLRRTVVAVAVAALGFTLLSGAPANAIAPTFTADTPPATATVGTAFSYDFDATGAGTVTYSLAPSSTLDTATVGITLNATTGVLSGTPALGKGGVYKYTVVATDSADTANPASTSEFTLTIAEAPSFTASTPGANAYTNAAYTYTFVARGYPAPTFAVSSGSLPAGITLNANTGVLSGTANAGAASTTPYTFKISATNASGTVETGNLNLTVSTPPSFTASAVPTTAVVGVPYSYKVVAAGTPTPTMSLSGNLPDGISFDGSTLSGTPTKAGSFTFAITATSAAGSSTLTKTVVVSTGAAPKFTASTPPANATVGVAYTYTYVATGTPTPSFSIAGSVPAGLSFDYATGVLSGTPTTAGTYNFTVTANNGLAATDMVANSITVYAAGVAPLFTASTPGLTVKVNTAYAGYTFAASGSGPITFSVSSGTLPTGMTLNAASGALAGTPTVAGSYTFKVKATNSTNFVETANITIVVGTAPAIAAATPTATAVVGTAITAYTFTITGTGPATWTVSSGDLPQGLALDAATGVLSGTPLAKVTKTFKVLATTPYGTSESLPITIAVSSPALGVSDAAQTVTAGVAKAVEAGNTLTTTVAANADKNGVVVSEASRWAISLASAKSATAKSDALNASSQLVVGAGRGLKVSGTGFLGGGEVRLYLLGADTPVATMTATSTGSVSGFVTIPVNAALGVKGLQLVGFTEAGAIRAITLGVTVAKVSTATKVVYFAKGKASLNDTAKLAANMALVEIPFGARILEVNTVGYIPSVKATTTAKKLAVSRAKNVMTFLEGKGVKDGIHTVSGTPLKLAKGYDRVVITITYTA